MCSLDQSSLSAGLRIAFRVLINLLKLHNIQKLGGCLAQDEYPPSWRGALIDSAGIQWPEPIGSAQTSNPSQVHWYLCPGGFLFVLKFFFHSYFSFFRLHLKRNITLVFSCNKNNTLIEINPDNIKRYKSENENYYHPERNLINILMCALLYFFNAYIKM